MKAKKNWIATIVLVAIVVATGYVTQVAGEAEQPAKTIPQLKYVSNQRDALAGLQGVYVAVEEFPPGSERYGLTQKALQTDVELRLRQNDVQVISFEEFMKIKSLPYLHVSVTPLINEKFDLAAVSILIELNELAFLVRSPTTCVRCTTWRENSVWLVGLNRLSEVRDKVEDLVDVFINDYLAANPKERPVEHTIEEDLN